MLPGRGQCPAQGLGWGVPPTQDPPPSSAEHRTDQPHARNSTTPRTARLHQPCPGPNPAHTPRARARLLGQARTALAQGGCWGAPTSLGALPRGPTHVIIMRGGVGAGSGGVEAVQLTAQNSAKGPQSHAAPPVQPLCQLAAGPGSQPRPAQLSQDPPSLREHPPRSPRGRS